MYASLYSSVGHTVWVRLRELVGDPLPPEIANAKPADKKGHDVRVCATKEKCPQHAQHFLSKIMTEVPLPQEG